MSHIRHATPKMARPNVVTVAVQVMSVVFTSMLRNLPTSQNPESFTWESAEAPAAIANTIAAILRSLRPAAVTSAAMSPPVVVMATVAEPSSDPEGQGNEEGLHDQRQAHPRER